MPLQANAQDYYPRTDAVLGVVTGISLVTPADYRCFTMGPRSALLKFILFEAFSAFPLGGALPNAIAFKYGTNTAFDSMQPATNFNGQFVPVVWAQTLLTGSPYIGGGQTLTFSLTAGVAGTGTCQATFIGSLL